MAQSITPPHIRMRRENKNKYEVTIHEFLFFKWESRRLISSISLAEDLIINTMGRDIRHIIVDGKIVNRAVSNK